MSSLQEIFDLLQNTEPIGNMLFAYQFDENLIKEKRFPTIEELDFVAPVLPLLLRRIDGHSCVINTAADKTNSMGKTVTKKFQRYSAQTGK